MISVSKEIEVSLDEFDDDDVIAYAIELMGTQYLDELSVDDKVFMLSHLRGLSDTLRASGNISDAYRIDTIVRIFEQ